MTMRSLTHAMLVSVLVVFSGMARAQQDPLYSQYMFNTLAFNPAYAGSAGVFSAMALSRHQWVGFSGAPSTQTLTVNSPIVSRSMALGGTLLNDKAGPMRQTGAFLDYAYRIRTGEGSQLAFGLRGGINVARADLASLNTVEVDPANADIRGMMMPNFGFGLFWHAPQWYAGLSLPKLVRNSFALEGVPLVSVSEERHYFLMGGYVTDLGPDLKFKPSMMLRVVPGAPVSLDLNGNFLLRERIWFGALYRLGNAFGLMAQYQANDQLRVGYAFDLTTTRLGAYNAGTHELMIAYDLRFFQGNAVSPRYF
jgi:type IX secretion system PorP/SprF family membrane protein